MDIRIGSYVAASFLLEQEPKQWHALVLLDSGMAAADFLKTHAKSYLCLRFDDIERDFPNKLPPTKMQIEQALSFAKGKDRLIVSCRAGQGRSVATAYVIACQENGTDEALRLLNPTRHRPNRLVVRLGESLVSERNVLARFENWQREFSHIQLSDYYDEMERESTELESQGASNKICSR